MTAEIPSLSRSQLTANGALQLLMRCDLSQLMFTLGRPGYLYQRTYIRSRPNDHEFAGPAHATATSLRGTPAPAEAGFSPDGVLMAAALMRLRNELIQPTSPPSGTTHTSESLRKVHAVAGGGFLECA